VVGEAFHSYPLISLLVLRFVLFPFFFSILPLSVSGDHVPFLDWFSVVSAPSAAAYLFLQLLCGGWVTHFVFLSYVAVEHSLSFFSPGSFTKLCRFFPDVFGSSLPLGVWFFFF